METEIKSINGRTLCDQTARDAATMPSTTNFLKGNGNGGTADSGLNPNLVIYAGAAQSLTDGQKTQARTNIGATSVVIDGIEQPVVAFESDPQTQISGKVDKVAGKGLSAEDYTTRDKRTLANLAELLKGNEYTVEQGTSPAYSQTVQTGAQRWAELSMVGGKSFAWNQFANATLTDWTKRRTSVTEENGKTKIAVTNGSSLKYVDYPAIVNHKYMISSEFETTAVVFWGIYTIGGTTYDSRNVINQEGTSFAGILSTSNTDRAVRLTFTTDATTDDYILLHNFMLIDLTPIETSLGVTISTVEEFKAIFQNDYYPYDAGSVKHCKCDKVVTADSEDTLIAEYPIPAAVQALDGYGWSAGAVFNEVDFAGNRYIKRVGSRTYQSGDESDETVVTDGTTTYYPLSESVITDISAYLPNGVYLDTEVGGTVTFHQADGAAFELLNEVNYMVRTAEV